MDTFHFPRPNSRIIIHHARCLELAPTIAELDSDASATPQRARHAREVLDRTIEEHPINRKVELFIPRLAQSDDAEAASAQFDPLTHFRSFAPTAAASSTNAASPLFSYTCLVPFSSLLSDSFLTHLLSSHAVIGLSISTSPDHSNAVQLTPGGILRFYLDTESFESLGLDAPSAHSEFNVCSQKGARSSVRERLITIDLIEHAKGIALHTKQPTADTGASMSDTSAPAKNKKLDRKLDRLRWVLNRCAPVWMQLLFLDQHGRCEVMPHFDGITDIHRIDISPKLTQFGLNGKSVSVPSVAGFSQLLPPMEVVKEVEQAKQKAKKQKHSTATTNAAAQVEGSEEQKDSSSLRSAPTAVVPYSTSTSFFPLLPNGTSSQYIWTDMLTYLGLVHGRMENCLADPNNTSNENLFIQQALCPYLEFHSSVAVSSTSSSSSRNTSVAAASSEAAAMEIEDDDRAEEDVISLAPSKKKSKSNAALKRKRNSGSDSASSSSSSSSLLPVSSASSLTFSGGLLSPSFISSLLSHSRALLASSDDGGSGAARIPFIAMTVWGADQTLTSWREKQHQVWMAGSDSAAGGGGENHYTVIILPESDTKRKQQQYVIFTMLGELDRTH